MFRYPEYEVIRYRAGSKQVPASVRADECSGSSKGGGPMIWHFDYKGARVANITENRLAVGMRDVVSRLFGRPYLKKVLDAKEIHIFSYHDYEDRLNGLPKDTRNVWKFGLDSRYHEMQHSWIIECKTRSLLHLFNNGEKSYKGDFKTALRKMFPGKVIKIHTTRVEHLTEEL